MAEEKQRLSPQEIQERKISLVKERGSRVLLINSPLGATLCTILRQFDLAYANFKGRLGEMGGISYEEGEALMAEGRTIVMAFSDFTDKLCRRIHFRYYTPREIEEYLRELEVQETESKCKRGAGKPACGSGRLFASPEQKWSTIASSREGLAVPLLKTRRRYEQTSSPNRKPRRKNTTTWPVRQSFQSKRVDSIHRFQFVLINKVGVAQNHL